MHACVVKWKKIRLVRQTDRTRWSAHQEVVSCCFAQINQCLFMIHKQCLLFTKNALSMSTLHSHKVIFSWWCYCLPNSVQMQLIATMRNPFIVEHKDSWVDKIIIEQIGKWVTISSVQYLAILKREIKSPTICLYESSVETSKGPVPRGTYLGVG
jgi:hypothetical protein